MGDRWRRRTLPRERPSPSTGHADAIKRRERVRDVLENEHLKSTNRKRGLAPQLQFENALVAAVATALERWIKKVSCGPNETGKEGPLAGGVSGRSCLTQMVHVFPFAADSPRHLPHRSRCAQACGQKTILQAAPPVGVKGIVRRIPSPTLPSAHNEKKKPAAPSPAQPPHQRPFPAEGQLSPIHVPAQCVSARVW